MATGTCGKVVAADRKLWMVGATITKLNPEINNDSSTIQPGLRLHTDNYKIYCSNETKEGK